MSKARGHDERARACSAFRMKRSSLARYVGGMGLSTAPSSIVARARMIHSLQFGSWQDTTAPGPIPAAARPCATRSAARASSCHVSRPIASTMAGFVGRSVAHRSR